uniref:Uncharacterized protein n=1 Tax=Rhizophora mucronata TaxID=61149 RepID=A0A2P2Q646_RHIMU
MKHMDIIFKPSSSFATLVQQFSTCLLSHSPVYIFVSFFSFYI